MTCPTVRRSSTVEDPCNEQWLAFAKTELTWLVEDIAPDLWQQVNQHLQIVLQGLANKPITLAVSSKQSEMLKGFIVREGTAITRGKLQIAFQQDARATATVLCVKKDTPVQLKQLSELERLIRQGQSVLEETSIDTTSVQATVNQLYHYIQLAQKIMYTTPYSSEETYETSNTLSHSFDPPLPSNISVNIYINRAAIILDGYLLYSENLSKFSYLSYLLNFHGWKKATPHIIKIGQQSMQVIDEIHVESQDPILLTIIDHLTAAERDIREFKQKIDLFIQESTDPIQNHNLEANLSH